MEYNEISAMQKKYFYSGKTKTYQYRLEARECGCQ